MKVGSDQTLRFTGDSRVQGYLRNLKKGTVFSARILQRLGPKQALIDIGGSSVRAEFLKGVPAGKYLSFVVQERRGTTFILRMIDEDTVPGPLKDLQRFTLFSQKHLEGLNPNRLNRMLQSGLESLYLLNRIWADEGDDKARGGKNITRLLNALMQKGLSRESLEGFLSLLNYSPDSRFIFEILQQAGFLPFSGKGMQEKDKKDRGHKGELLEEAVQDILNGASEGLYEDWMIQEVIELLISSGRQVRAVVLRERFWPYEDEGEWKVFRILEGEQGILCSLDLSALGHLEILLRMDQALHISFFAGSPEAVEVLRGRFDELRSLLSGRHRDGVVLNVSSLREALEKIIEINNSLTLTSNFDIKV